MRVEGEHATVSDFTADEHDDDGDKKAFARGGRVCIQHPSGHEYTQESHLTFAQAVDLHATLGSYLMLKALER